MNAPPIAQAFPTPAIYILSDRVTVTYQCFRDITIEFTFPVDKMATEVDVTITRPQHLTVDPLPYFQDACRRLARGVEAEIQ